MEDYVLHRSDNMTNFFTAKSIYRHIDQEVSDENSVLYEERMVLIESDSFDNALIEAEREAIAYAEQFENVTFAGYIDLYELNVRSLSPGSEFYSLIRRCPLEIDDYIDKFYDTGAECERDVIDKTMVES